MCMRRSGLLSPLSLLLVDADADADTEGTGAIVDSEGTTRRRACGDYEQRNLHNLSPDDIRRVG